MGYNTLAFVHNDHLHDLEKTPKTLTWLLTHPHAWEREHIDAKLLFQLSEEFKEPVFDIGALRVLKSVHASDDTFYMLGGNTVYTFPWDKATFKTIKGRKYVMLEMPDYRQPPPKTKRARGKNHDKNSDKVSRKKAA